MKRAKPLLKFRQYEVWVSWSFLFGVDLSGPPHALWIGPFEFTYWRREL